MELLYALGIRNVAGRLLVLWHCYSYKKFIVDYGGAVGMTEWEQRSEYHSSVVRQDWKWKV